MAQDDVKGLAILTLFSGTAFFLAGGLMLWRIQKILEIAEKSFVYDLEDETEESELEKTKEE